MWDRGSVVVVVVLIVVSVVSVGLVSLSNSDPRIDSIDFSSFNSNPQLPQPFMHVSIRTWVKNCLFGTLSKHMFEGLSDESFITDEDTLFPEDAAEHFLDILNQTSHLPPFPMHVYANYSGPWIENHWINLLKSDDWQTPLHTKNMTVLRGWLQTTFGGAIPLFIPWTDMVVRNNIGIFTDNCANTESPNPERNCILHNLLTNVLRRNVAYVTVSQHDCGILGAWCKGVPRTLGARAEIPPHIRKFIKNILVFSAGGYGHIPIPLIKSSLPALNTTIYIPPNNRTYKMAFFGTVKHAPMNMRQNLQTALERWSVETKSKTFVGTTDNWIEEMANTALNLSPRGYGRASFHTYEAIQLGLVPVNIYTSDNWIPYKGSPNDHILSFKYNSERRLPEPLTLLAQTITTDVVVRKESLLRSLRDSHYTYEGTINQILNFLAKGPDVSDLRCDAVPLTIRA